MNSDDRERDERRARVTRVVATVASAVTALASFVILVVAIEQPSSDCAATRWTLLLAPAILLAVHFAKIATTGTGFTDFSWGSTDPSRRKLAAETKLARLTRLHREGMIDGVEFRRRLKKLRRDL